MEPRRRDPAEVLRTVRAEVADPAAPGALGSRADPEVNLPDSGGDSYAVSTGARCARRSASRGLR